MRISVCIYHEPMKAFLVCASNRSLKMVFGVNLRKCIWIEPMLRFADQTIEDFSLYLELLKIFSVRATNRFLKMVRSEPVKIFLVHATNRFLKMVRGANL